MALIVFTIFSQFFVLLVSAKSFTNSESNEIMGEPNPWLDVPTCTHNTACGYLQANVKGINKQPMCACPNHMGPCPFVWDSYDGHSVTQGSDQYKYCGKAPVLSECIPGQLAYKSVQRYNTLTWDVEERSETLHCVCPEGFTYEPQDVNEEESSFHHTIIGTYACEKQKTCTDGDPCKTISESPQSFLVNNKCSCPKGLSCPTLSASKSGTLEFFPGSAVKLVRCQ